MVGTMAGRSRRSGGTLCVVLIVLFAFIMDDVLASSEGNASTSPNTGDGSDGLSDGTTMEKGMKPFFDMVKNFLGVVQPHKLTEQTWLSEYQALFSVTSVCALKRLCEGNAHTCGCSRPRSA
ncbi:hypothetical protein BaRGS_00000799 [Batillaria attramentaria]|uniref:Uncharacterized protein n=1 Tax=Batillaria attramentaria TaxID=370345 RepID=A0ABD0M8T5_9CAEN